MHLAYDEMKNLKVGNGMTWDRKREESQKVNS